jgi:hypothetical protein
MQKYAKLISLSIAAIVFAVVLPQFRAADLPLLPSIVASAGIAVVAIFLWEAFLRLSDYAADHRRARKPRKKPHD